MRCLLYTSDAADERSSVDLGGRRIIKKKKCHDEVGCDKCKPKRGITKARRTVVEVSEPAKTENLA